MIDTVISTRGTLVYESPNHLQRISDKGEGFLLDGRKLALIVDHQVVRELDISDLAPLEAMIGAMSDTFSGDLAALRANYRLEYKQGETHWTLGLIPRNSRLSTVFQRIQIVGNGSAVTSIKVEESDGDQRTLRMQVLARKPAGLD